MSEERSFADLFEQSLQVNMSMKKGDKVKGEVIDIQKDTIFVNLGGRQDGVLDAKDFTDPEGNLTVKIGDEIEAFVAESGADGIKLRRQMGGRAIHEVDKAVEEAFQSKMPIEGKVTAERKKDDKVVGYAVQIAGSEAFCPASQIDGRGVHRDSADYIGQSYTFRITEYAEDGYKLVVSRRLVLEEEEAEARQKLLANIQVGDLFYGTVASIQPYGAFVDLGGVDGLVPNRELSWDRGVRPEDIVKVGQRIQVKVVSYEPGEGKQRARIGLSLKQASGVSPWEAFVADPAFAVGTKHSGTVVRLADFGAFINIAPGIDGLAHISQLGAEQRVNHPSEVVKVGDEIEVKILDLDPEKERISLSRKATMPRPWAVAEEKYAVGSIVEGKVVRITTFGAFVELEPGLDGLVHISKLDKKRTEKVEDVCKVGDEMKVKFLGVDEKGRMNLSRKDAIKEREALGLKD